MKEASRLHLADNIWKTPVANGFDFLILFNFSKTSFEHVVSMPPIEQLPCPLVDARRRD
jgi:hypothetical protein